MFRIFVIALVLLLLSLQYRLWIGAGGRTDVHRLKSEIAEIESENKSLRARNAALEAEIEDLKQGEAAMEERARTDLGMIMKGESFFLIVEPPKIPWNTAPESPAESPDDGAGAEQQPAD